VHLFLLHRYGLAFQARYFRIRTVARRENGQQLWVLGLEVNAGFLNKYNGLWV
jgi:hypothetical protein